MSTYFPNINIPTYHKYQVMYDVIDNLRIKHKRRVFLLMRECETLSINSFFPHFGFTAGEFATWHLLTDNIRKAAAAADN
jgi:hypothetical protein